MSGKVRRKRPTKQRSCGDKIVHTEHQAKQTAGFMRRQAQRVSAYRCLFCRLPNGARAWHVGHRMRR